MAASPIPPRFWAVFFTLAGAFPLCCLYFGNRLFTLAFSQIGLLRVLGVGTVLAVVFVGLSLVGAWVGVRLPEGSRRITMARGLFVLLAVGNFAAVGLGLFYHAPGLAPRMVQAAAAVGVVAVSWRILTQPSPIRDFLVRGLARLGLVPMVVSLAAGPVVLVAAVTQSRPEITVRPLPRHAAVRDDRPRRIVLVSLDSLRAQSTSFNNPALATPALEALATTSTVFLNCRSAGDRTQVSMFTSLTGIAPEGVFPHVHNRMGYVQQGAFTGLAGHLKAAGYRAVYFTMKIEPGIFGIKAEFEGGRQNALFLPDNDFNGQAFVPMKEVGDWVWARLTRQRESGHGAIQHEVPATRHTFRLARTYLKAQTDPAFVWVHIGAPHLPYYDVPPADLGGTLHPSRYRQVTMGDGLAADAREMLEIERIYQRYTAFVDAELGLFLEGLQADGQWKDTMVVVMADHGESFELDGFPHARGRLSESVTHVPLLIHRAGQTTPRRVKDFVGHVDVVPTLLSQVYPRLPAGLTGLDLLADRPLPPRIVQSWGRYERFTERESKFEEIALYADHFKYVRDYMHGGERLYDLARDPYAQHDVAAAHPEVMARMRKHPTLQSGQ